MSNMLETIFVYLGTLLGYYLVIKVCEVFTIDKLPSVFTNHYVNISIFPIFLYLLHTFNPYKGFKISFLTLLVITILRAVTFIAMKHKD